MMRLGIKRVSRRPDWPAWAVGAALGWLALVAAACWFSAHTGHDVRLCLFHRLTGLSCPTCGSTRMTLSLLRGDVQAAVGSNPLVFAAAAVAGALLVMRLVAGRAVRLELSRRQRLVVWLGLLAAFLGNWVYVLICVG